jgi:hypothetical protein
MSSDIPAVLAKIAGILDQLQIDYVVGGSIASSIYGIPRATQDIDILIDLKEEKVRAFFRGLKHDFYVDEQNILAAVQGKRSFNAIHLRTMYKIDMFISNSSDWAREEIKRRKSLSLTADPDAPVFHFSSPEDNILHKLEWYRMGRESSERQWRDVLGVLRIQGESLDFAYLRRWASTLGISDLLDRAMKEKDSSG